MIKKQRNKLLTFLVAGLIGTSALGGALLGNTVANAAVETYSINTIFSTSSASTSNVTESDKKILKFAIKDSGKITYTRDLAFKWFEKADGAQAAEAKFMNMNFKFANTDFKKVTFKFETASLVATKDDKAIHSVVFTKDGDAVKASVNDSKKSYDVNTDEVQALGLAAGSDENTFKVMLGGNEIGEFANVGANFAEYDTSKEINSFVIEAETATDKSAEILFYDLNGQSLALNGDNKFVDDTAPVLVVNDDIKGFEMYSAFALDYEVIDVLDRTVSKTLKFYQYDPDDAKKAKAEAAEGADPKAPEYKTFSTSTYFYEKNYSYKEGETEKTTSVFKKAEMEYASFQFTLSDDASKSATYYLDWYLSGAVVNVDKTVLGVEEVKGYTDIDYVKLYKTEKGPQYTFLTVNETTDNTTQKVTYSNSVKEYGQNETDPVKSLQFELNSYNVDTCPTCKVVLEDNQIDKGKCKTCQENVEYKELSAGDGSYLYLPSLKGLFTDDGGYSNLRFTISYKTTLNNTARTSSGLAPSALKLEVTESGDYEFKIFAVDGAGNTMQYANEDGELVDVTASNVWDIDEIPVFSVKVAKQGLSVEEKSTRSATEVLGGTYDIPSFDIVGPSNPTTEYALFRIDETKLSGLTLSKLKAITYSEIATYAESVSQSTEKGLDFYKTAYATLLAQELGSNVTVDAVKAALIEISEYNDQINEETHADAWAASDNKYEWKPESKSFKAQDYGMYLVVACFTDPDVPVYNAGAYMIVSVEAKEDKIEGDDEWLKNNLVSVILFGVAGVMLILIIVLLVVKPSDETLEDIDNGETKKAKKAKKSDEELEKLDEENK